MASTLKKGTEIRCPRKRHLIGVLNVDVGPGGLISVNSIDFESGQERIAGEPTKCKLCSSQYFVNNRIHTSNGWWPDDPDIEPVSRRG